jgi:ribosomal protein S18 acetylase RimI-like enzyme
MTTPGAALHVRPASAAERSAVVDLWSRCRLTVPHNDPQRDFDLAVGKPASDVLVGVLDGRIVASVMVGHDGHRGWLYYVAVDTELQGRGLGAAIVAAGEDWLAARGVPKAMLMVRETNTAVEGFYHAVGYETVPRLVLQKWLRREPG